jgi:hypothetical protein
MVLKCFIGYVSYVPVLTARSAVTQGQESKNNIKISYHPGELAVGKLTCRNCKGKKPVQDADTDEIERQERLDKEREKRRGR